MPPLRLTFLGSGDAFGSGGRLQTCMLVEGGGACFLIDCGTTALIGMRRHGVAPNAIDTVLLSHLHGDHFGGLPFLILDAQLISKRTRPLVVAGPPGTRERVLAAMEVMFPGSATARRGFALEFHEYRAGRRDVLGRIGVTPYQVRHPSGAPPFALRVECAGKIIAYTGDTEWTDSLIAAAEGADLLVAEAYFYDKPVKFHLDYRTLMDHLSELRPKRLVLTHMSADMLARLETLDCEAAEDGMVVRL